MFEQLAVPERLMGIRALMWRCWSVKRARLWSRATQARISTHIPKQRDTQPTVQVWDLESKGRDGKEREPDPTTRAVAFIRFPVCRGRHATNQIECVAANTLEPSRLPVRTGTRVP